jgi:hypothetical protein
MITTERLSELSPFDNSKRHLFDALMNFREVMHFDPDGESEIYVPFQDKEGNILGDIVDVEYVPFSDSEDGIVEFYWTQS